MDSYDCDISSPSSSVSEDFSPSFIGKTMAAYQSSPVILHNGYDYSHHNSNDEQQASYQQQLGHQAQVDDQKHRRRHRRHHPTEKNWRTDETELLVKLWGENEELYNANHPFYMDRAKKSQILKDFAKKLNSTEIEVKRKMRSLQSYYCQIRREILNNKGSGTTRKTKWSFFEMLRFLDDNLASRNASNDVTLPIEHVTSSSVVLSSDVKPTREEDFIASLPTPPPPPIESPRIAIPFEQKIDQQKEDNVFGDLVALKIGKIPDEDIKEELKIEILQSILAAKPRASKNL